MPSKDEIDQARKFVATIWPYDDKKDRPYTYEALEILFAAYHAEKARTELLEQQYAELKILETSPAYLLAEFRDRILARHEAERKAAGYE